LIFPHENNQLIIIHIIIHLSCSNEDPTPVCPTQLTKLSCPSTRDLLNVLYITKLFQTTQPYSRAAN
jgi:hypothetical protein